MGFRRYRLLLSLREWPESPPWSRSLNVGRSGYTGGIDQIIQEFHISTEVATLGLSLFVLGFAIGPLFWAPLSELYGRQILFSTTYMALTAFNAGAAGSKNIETLLVLRFLAGAFGSSPLTNAGGVSGLTSRPTPGVNGFWNRSLPICSIQDKEDRPWFSSLWHPLWVLLWVR